MNFFASSYGPAMDLLTLQGLPGPAFLFLYASLMILFRWHRSILVKIYLRSFSSTNEKFRLTDYQLAYLAGEERVVQVALAKLYAARAISVETTSQPPVLKLREAIPPTNAVEKAALEVATSSGTLATLVDLVKRKDHIQPKPNSPWEFYEKLHETLLNQGLLLSEMDRLLVRFYDLILSLPLFCLGFARTLIGIDLHKNVEYLAFLLMVYLGICLYDCFNPARLTLAGVEHIEKAKDENAALIASLQGSDSHLQVDDVAMAAAIFGVGALGASYWPAQLSATNSSGCGSSCGGGGGCGGGGCGG